MCFRGEWQKGHDCSFGNSCGSCPDWNIIDAVLILSTAMLILWVSEYKDTYISKTGENSDCATRRIPVKMSTVDSVDFTGEPYRFGGYDIPLAPPVMQLRSEDFFKIFSTSQHHLHTNRRILLKANSRFSAPEGRKIRLFCCRRKWCVLQGNTPFPASAVAEGITH